MEIDIANKIYDVLVEHAELQSSYFYPKHKFIEYLMRGFRELPFGTKSGHGKFYNVDRFYVTVEPENKEVNQKLEELLVECSG